jgi:uncharacterized membrane protein
MGIKAKGKVLYRSNLRDIIVICSFVSALFYGITEGEMAIGFFLLAIGCFLHIITKGILIRNVTLCTGGVYRVVRHPYYLSSYLIDSSFCLLSGNHLLVLLYPFLFFWSYRPTMRKEDMLLAERYGDTFTSYRREVPDVFPDRNSFRHLATLFGGFSKERLTWKECARVSRFCSLGIFLTLLHDVVGNGLNSFHIYSPVLRDWGEVLFALLAGILYVASFVFARKADQNGHRTEGTYD